MSELVELQQIRISLQATAVLSAARELYSMKQRRAFFADVERMEGVIADKEREHEGMINGSSLTGQALRDALAVLDDSIKLSEQALEKKKRDYPVLAQIYNYRYGIR